VRGNRDNIIGALERFTVTAKDDFADRAQVLLREIRENLVKRRFAGQPERVRISDSVAVSADAEHAVAHAAVRDVDIERVAQLIEDSHERSLMAV
jgi:hypothetical protein